MPLAAMEVCWICGSAGQLTREHLPKVSDTRLMYGRSDAKNPLYKHDVRPNASVQSERSRALTSGAPICAPCNNERTRPYDLAWERLSRHLQVNWDQIRRRGYVDLTAVFPGSTRQGALDVHLYFVKAFGCRIVEHEISIDTRPFAHALLARTAHPNVKLTLCDASGAPSRDLRPIFLTQIYTWSLHGELAGASWIYSLGDVAMKIAYVRKGSGLRVRGGGWHPSRSAKQVKLGEPIG